MCYSAEVSLGVGTCMVAGSAYTWSHYIRPLASQPESQNRASFLKAAVAGHLCVASHQFFEFLAITTESQFIYRIGLMTSLSCMLWLLWGVEKLGEQKIGFRACVLLWAIIAIDMLLRPMKFENRKFWVRGYTHVPWGAAWIFLFAWWNVCMFRLAGRANSPQGQTILRRGTWSILNLSYALAAAYSVFCFISTRQADSFDSFFLCVDPTSAHDIVQDMPSIWCVFAALQVFLMPGFIRKLKAHPDAIVLSPATPMRSQEIAKRLLWTLVLCCIAYSIPVFQIVASKMVTH